MRGSVVIGCVAAAFLDGSAAAQNTAPPPAPRTVRLAGGRFALPAGVKPELTPFP